MGLLSNIPKRTKIHKGCGGTIEQGICTKCGEQVKSSLKRWLEEPLVTRVDKEEELRASHRARLRSGRDIFK